jgi:putative IMPACT (imprinted ancient) family translation regulator
MSAGEENQELLSAILTAFAETKKCNMILEVMPRIFSIRTEANNYNYSYNNWGLNGNNLYYLSTDDDRKEFSRMMKLKKLTHDRLQTGKEKDS